MIPIFLADAPESPTRSDACLRKSNVYLPIIVGPPAEPATDPAAEFCRLLVGDARQQRPTLTLCPALQQAAIWRAHGLANGEPWSHTDSHGVTPNEYARRAGCRLPADYAECGNNIEELVAGSADPYIAFGALAGSTKHSDHLFGRGWFVHQRHYGIAMVEGPGVYRWYWCILIGLCGEVSGE